MPKQVGKASINVNAVLQKHKSNEVDYGQDFTRLPGGISGVARLVTATIGKYKNGKNEGKEFFRAAAVVVEPDVAVNTVKLWEPDPKKPKGKVTVKSAEKMRVRGLQTSIMVPLCETSQNGDIISADDNAAMMINEIKKLGGENFLDDLEDSDSKDFASHAGLRAKLEELTSAKPYVRFTTRLAEPTKDYPESRAFEKWLGSKGLEDYEGPDEGSAVEEDEEPATEAEETEPQETVDEEETQEAGVEAEATGDDLDELARLADDEDDNEAKERLTAAAQDAGMADNEIEGAENWAAVAQAIRDAAPGAEAGDEESVEEEAEAVDEEEAEVEEEEEPAPPPKKPAVKAPAKKPAPPAKAAPAKPSGPKKGGLYLARLVDPKTKKRAAKASKVEIDSVDAVKKLATVRDLTTKKLHRGVPFADLTPLK